MIRGLILVGAGAVGGYIAGAVGGYRAAVADYVENDARTIRSMADSMYDTAEPEDMPEEIQQLMMQGDDLARGEPVDDSDEDDDDDDSRAFA